MNNIRYYNYGEYSSDNYGAHTLCFETPQGKYWFSYNTLVAFEMCGEFHIIQNYWGPTTGKHLNWINDNKAIREDKEMFEENLDRLTSQFNLEEAC